METFIESERICQTTFLDAGTSWFASSPGKENFILFTSEEDFTFAIYVTAQVAFLFPNVKIITFVVMNNHFHFVIQCDCESEIHEFFSAVKKRLQRLFPQIRPTKLELRPINDLNYLRNTIVYTHRNGYVANPECIPFNYRWSTDRFYFNDIPVHKFLRDLNVSQRRIMFKGRDPQLPSEWDVVDDHLDPHGILFCQVWDDDVP